MTVRIDRTLPHHPSHAHVLDTPPRRHATPDHTTSAAAAHTSATSRTHRHIERHRDQR
ncbi:hypothetical protein Mycsm_07304 (plasmid) [Mycobacterium sp. JS623]|uniref:hypothetical protein n=1 Tax=Mycobacterium sp. JS623 TaxID=212767 RepID=UPI0002A58E00|nr:hypothetical protein [Mycobacterium sp. JS623]AGB27396.1 hypothetical protein Mycsm_07304 [Mycobacterium sp. JS623]